MKKLLQELREAIGRAEGRPKINQQELGNLLTPTRKISAMQQYERGVAVPKEFIAQFAALARKAGRPLLAEQFEAQTPERPKRPVMSSEEMISAIAEELREVKAMIAQLVKQGPGKGKP